MDCSPSETKSLSSGVPPTPTLNAPVPARAAQAPSQEASPPGILPHHLADLRRSGLSDATIVAAGIHSETDHRKLAGILNRKTWPRTWGCGLVFPFYDESGTVVLNRIKPDNPPTRRQDSEVFAAERSVGPHLHPADLERRIGKF